MIYAYIPLTPNKPIGGVGALLEYIYSINFVFGPNAGAVLSDSSYIKDWQTPIFNSIKVYPTSHAVTNKDAVIIPEVCPDVILQYPDAKRKYLSVLNWKYYEDVLETLDPVKLGYHHIITNSEFDYDYLREKKFKIPTTVISPIIDGDMFSNRVPINERPNNSIVILNRKNTHHIAPILTHLKERTHRVTIVNNISPDHLSNIFNENQIFVSLGYPEGFGRPAAEAMACGCIVVGFSGGGGNEFMHHNKNSFVSPDGDGVDLIANLDHVLNDLPIRKKVAISNAVSKEILKHYSEQHNFTQVYRLFRDMFPKSKKGLQKIKGRRIKIRKNRRKISEKDLFIDRLIKDRNYLSNSLKTSNSLFKNSNIFRLWRFYRYIVEFQFLKKKHKLDF